MQKILVTFCFYLVANFLVTICDCANVNRSATACDCRVPYCDLLPTSPRPDCPIYTPPDCFYTTLSPPEECDVCTCAPEEPTTTRYTTIFTCPPCTRPTTEPPLTTTPCPSYEDNPTFTKPIYQSSLPTWPIAGTTVRLGIHANTSDSAPVRYQLLTSFEFLTLTTEQNIIFTSNVGDGAFVGPNNVMVIDVTATVIGNDERISSAAVVIIFPRSTSSSNVNDTAIQDSATYWTDDDVTTEPTTPPEFDYCCWYCFGYPTETTCEYVTVPCPEQTTPPLPTCPPCECPTPSPTTRITAGPTTCSCPEPTTPSTTTPQPCPKYEDNPTFTKSIYQSSLPTWPIAGTTVRLGIHANTSDEAPVRYELLTSFEFLTLTAEQNIIFTSNVGDGAFVGPNNVMVIEIVAAVIGNEKRTSSSAVIIVFPRSTATTNNDTMGN